MEKRNFSFQNATKTLERSEKKTKHTAKKEKKRNESDFNFYLDDLMVKGEWKAMPSKIRAK